MPLDNISLGVLALAFGAIQSMLLLALGIVVYWAKRQDSRTDVIDTRLDEIERVVHTQYVPVDNYNRDQDGIKKDYQREQDLTRQWLTRIEAKIDSLIARHGKKDCE